MSFRVGDRRPAGSHPEKRQTGAATAEPPVHAGGDGVPDQPKSGNGEV